MRVRGEGSLPADLMWVGEAPGEHEDRSGRPFVGKAGIILDSLIEDHLEPLGIRRRDLYLTNLVKERPPNNRDPLPEEIERDAPELAMELEACQPRLIVTLGRFATRRFLGEWADMETCHGMAWPAQVGEREVEVFPVYHPAAGLHNPDLYAYTAFDVENLARYLDGETQDRFGGSLQAGVDVVELPDYHEVRERESFAGPVTAVDTEGDTADPICLSTTMKAGESVVIPAHLASRVSVALDTLGRVVMHHSLHDLPVLRAMGVNLRGGNVSDTMVMAYLLRMEPQGLKALARRRAGMAMRDYDEVVGHWIDKGKKKIKRVWSIAGRTLRDVDHEELVRYAGRDPDATLRVHAALAPRIDALGLRPLFDMELGIIPIIDRMQTVGMQVNLPYFADVLAPALATARAVKQAELEALAGYEINVKSPKVSHLLFEELHIASRKKTKGGKSLSTNDKILEALHHRYLRDEGIESPRTRALGLVMDIRELRQMESSFVWPLPQHVSADGRLHPNVLTTRVKTGRLAGKGINVLALPKHSEWGHQFRAGFVAGPGRRLGSWDLSQIELRVLAHISGDTTMTAAFKAGRDLHAELVQRLLGVPPERQTPKQRREGKIVNFAIPMGITAQGLLEQWHKNGLLTKTLDDAEETLYDTLHRVYPGVWAFQEDAKAEARRTGQVRDMWNRIYYLPHIHSPFENMREAAAREAAALKIQGGAAGLMKLGMAVAWELTTPLRAEGAYCEPWLQVHDDLLFEYDEALEGVMAPLIASAITGAVSLSVPVTCNHVAGATWGELE